MIEMRRAVAWTMAAALATAGGRAAAQAPSGDRLESADIQRIVLEPMDPKADPCADFYQYACGGWVAKTQLPGDQSRYVRSFSVIREQNTARIRALLEEAGKTPGGDADRARVGAFYAACIDEAAVEKAGVTPLTPMLDAIGTADLKQAMRIAGWQQRQNAGPFLSLSIAPDPKNPDTTIAHAGQGGLGMPDRDYYVSTDPKKKELMKKYQAHVARMLGLLGGKPAQAQADAREIVALETALAKASRPSEDLRFPEKLYNKMDVAGLKKLAPRLDWDAFLEGLGAPGLTDLNVATPEFFEALDKAVAGAKLPALRAYLRWTAVNAAAPLLASAFVNADFEFYRGALTGQKEIRARQKRCVDATEGALGESVSRLYIERYFGGESKDKATTMMKDIQDAFVASLPGLVWMDDETRGRAREKSAALEPRIGFPAKFRDYSKLVLPGGYYANAIAAAEFEAARQLAKVSKPTDRLEWGMLPHEVNALYSPLRNQITFPAGILQPPFFHRDYPAAMNYGAVGTVMGHELTHGFDDQGRKFDPKGELREWWAPGASQRFEQQAKCVEELYSTYEVQPGVHVNGALTSGENIADLGGLKQAYAAFKANEKRSGPQPAFGGLTPEQQFFLGHAQAWCEKITPEEQRRRVTVDVHSPSTARVIGPITQHPAFAKAFSCKEGAPMNPARKCEVW